MYNFPVGGYSCHSMRNTIEGPWKSFNQDQESARSTACTASDAPFRDSHSLELGILDCLDCLDRGSCHWYRDLQCLAIEPPSLLDLDGQLD